MARMMNDESDEFWQIALDNSPKSRRMLATSNTVSAEADTDSDNLQRTGKRKSYFVPWKHSMPPIHLSLASLADQDGVWNPVGAEAWYASALLVALLLESTVLQTVNKADQHSRLSRFLAKTRSERAFVALELGSGAVGLAGIALALILGETVVDAERPPLVILTDNEPSVLATLNENVQSSLETLQKTKAVKCLPAIETKFLDWDHPQNKVFKAPKLNLVFGSELVYTHETALACSKMVTNLLTHHPDALVFLLQVTDRDGWDNTFLPIIRQRFQVQTENAILNPELHQLAQRIVPSGGTLDRFSFGGVYIFNSNSMAASLLG